MEFLPSPPPSPPVRWRRRGLPQQVLPPSLPPHLSYLVHFEGFLPDLVVLEGPQGPALPCIELFMLAPAGSRTLPRCRSPRVGEEPCSRRLRFRVAPASATEARGRARHRSAGRLPPIRVRKYPLPAVNSLPGRSPVPTVRVDRLLPLPPASLFPPFSIFQIWLLLALLTATIVLRRATLVGHLSLRLPLPRLVVPSPPKRHLRPPPWISSFSRGDPPSSGASFPRRASAKAATKEPGPAGLMRMSGAAVSSSAAERQPTCRLCGRGP